MPFQEVSGEKIREARLARMLDQTELASRLRRRGFGTTQATVSRWERGQSPRAYVLPALAAELGVEIAELYADTPVGDDEGEETDLLFDLRSALEKFIDRRVATLVGVR